MDEHTVKTRSVSQAIFHISASIMFLSLALLFILGALQIRQSGDVVSSYLNELSAIQKESQKGINEIHVTARGAIKSIDAYFREISAQQKAIQEDAKKVGDLLNDVAAYFAAISLEEANVLSPTDANAIAAESIANISAKSERWGKIARACNDYIRRERRTEWIGELPKLQKKTEKGKANDPGVVRLRFTSASGSFVQNAQAGQLFVITGAISNNYNAARSYVLVKGSILDDKGQVVKTKVAYAGNVFTENELQNLTMEQIDQGLRNRAGKGSANVNIQPQSSVPFMIVFEELPDNLSEFTVEPVSSSPDR